VKIIKYLIVILAVTGAVVSALTVQVHYSAKTQPCSINEHWDCGGVNHNSFSVIGNVPVGVIGIVGYLTLAELVLMQQHFLAFLVASIGLVFALRLSYRGVRAAGLVYLLRHFANHHRSDYSAQPLLTDGRVYCAEKGVRRQSFVAEGIKMVCNTNRMIHYVLHGSNAMETSCMSMRLRKGKISMTHKKWIALAFVFMLSLMLPIGFAHAQQASSMLVTTDWLATHGKDANLVVLYIGNDPRAYHAGHIPGARLIALGNLVQRNPGGWFDLPSANALKTMLEQAGVWNRSHVVLYDSNKGLLAARAYFTLDYLGLGARTSILDGGWEKWTSERRPTDTAIPATHPAQLTVTPHPEIAINLSGVRKAVSGKNIPILDARAPAEFAGYSGAIAGRAGHIPGAKNVFWADNLSGNGTLKSIATIRARYLAAGLKPGAKEIVYCHGGIQAAHNYFTLKLAGFHPILYSGSFAEWASATGTQVDTAGK